MQPSRKPLRRTLIGLLSLCLLGSLTACAHRGIQAFPPEQYLAPCVAEPFTGKTNGDLLQDDKAVRQSLGRCDDDKTALREWVSTAKAKLK